MKANNLYTGYVSYNFAEFTHSCRGFLFGCFFNLFCFAFWLKLLLSTESSADR